MEKAFWHLIVSHKHREASHVCLCIVGKLSKKTWGSWPRADTPSEATRTHPNCSVSCHLFLLRWFIRRAEKTMTSAKYLLLTPPSVTCRTRWWLTEWVSIWKYSVLRKYQSTYETWQPRYTYLEHWSSNSSDICMPGFVFLLFLVGWFSFTKNCLDTSSRTIKTCWTSEVKL